MENMENNFDVIIAGCGAAGLYGAINLPSDCRILLLCKQELTLCNSALAQGGIAGVYKLNCTSMTPWLPAGLPTIRKRCTF